MRLGALALSTASGIMYCVAITLENLSICTKVCSTPNISSFRVRVSHPIPARFKVEAIMLSAVSKILW